MQEARELRSVEAGEPARSRLPVVDVLEAILIAVLVIAAPIGAGILAGPGAAMLTLAGVSLILLVLLRFGE